MFLTTNFKRIESTFCMRVYCGILFIYGVIEKDFGEQDSGQIDTTRLGRKYFHKFGKEEKNSGFDRNPEINVAFEHLSPAVERQVRLCFLSRYYNEKVGYVHGLLVQRVLQPIVLRLFWKQKQKILHYFSRLQRKNMS